MTIKNFFDFSTRPKLYASGSHQMWTDEYISKQLLRIHLDPDIDLASRRQASIKRTVDWIISKAGNKRLRILDLGCGPGLYAELLAGLGHSVTGVDFSAESIGYARNRAAENDLNIKYLNANYLDVDLPENSFDLVIMIYTDFGVLIPDARSLLLNRIRGWLNHGGIFIFDVLNDRDFNSKITPPSWDCMDGGFWSYEPCLHLSDSFIYESDKIILYRHQVITDGKTSPELKTYHFWTHFFSREDLNRLMTQNGFTTECFRNNILPDDSSFSGDNVTFAVVKPVKQFHN